MRLNHEVPLAELTTLRVGGPAATVVRAESDDEVVEAVRTADDAGSEVLVVGGGSNLVVSDDGFDGTVVLVATRGLEAQDETCAGAWVRIAAGEPWDDVVALAVERGWSGVEALSGIPGAAGATPIQNVGAYGQEVGDTLARVDVYDRSARARRTLAVADCGLTYRSSRFKAEAGRFVVLGVTLQLPLASLGAPVRYAELARALGVELGVRAPAAEVRGAVLDLRRGKAMVLDPDDHDTWSAGSFFTNPVLEGPAADALPAAAPRYPQPDGRIKTSAAWLIEAAGFSRGYAVRPGAPAALSSRHTLALTNRGGATTSDLLELARHLRDGVRSRFGIMLEAEPILVGCSLDVTPSTA